MDFRSQKIELVQQRIDNEVCQIQRRLRKEIDDEDDYLDQFHNRILLHKLEHLQEYKQVRVEFYGDNNYVWANQIFFFSIFYDNSYPDEPPIVKFPKQIQHISIIKGTGQYCIPDLSKKYWKPSTKILQIINRVISTFNENPIYSDYPVDFSILNLTKNKQEYMTYVEEMRYQARIAYNQLVEDQQDREKRLKVKEQQKLKGQEQQSRLNEQMQKQK
ncbi:ubiquitin ISG15-conjugating enzyme E2 L6 [Paramecium bursaria]